MPYLGNPELNGKDSVYPTIADFSFIDQDSQVVTNKTFQNKAYVADFIFLSCPTICPIMTKEMKHVYDAFAQDDRVAFLSHTIDPERDTVGRLKKYAAALGVNTAKWHFVTGNQDSIMNIAAHSYFSAAHPDSADASNFIHSGGLLLIDKNRYIRGVYDGSDPEETKQLIADIKTLLKEQF
ncbi:SCO family protein [Niabella beijingensis]|uniref:SCO family protein n=1 Tax=Niabella beijingensis TaxID=2872700 RepID=UPI001CBE183D|nr:SCO family protein [Niabella beijingensis]MBZ4190544.1 SCO family protein [Niabella beijingensis]